MESNWDLIGCVDDEPYPDGGDTDSSPFQDLHDLRILDFGGPLREIVEQLKSAARYLPPIFGRVARDLKPITALADQLSQEDAAKHGSTIEPAKVVKGHQLPARVFNHGPREDPFRRSAKKKR